LKAGATGSLKLTFSGGDMLYSDSASTQISYVKYVQSGVTGVIPPNLLSTSDLLETITISGIQPTNTNDLTIAVKLIGPDGSTGGAEILKTVFTSQFEVVVVPLTFRTAGGIQNTTSTGTLLLNGTQWKNANSSIYQAAVLNKAFIGDFTTVIKFGSDYSALAMLCSQYASPMDFKDINRGYYSASDTIQNFQPTGAYSYSIPIHFYNSSSYYAGSAFANTSTTHYKYTRSGNYISISYCNTSATGPWTLISSATIQSTDLVICLIGQCAVGAGANQIATIISEAIYDMPVIDIDPNNTLSYSGSGSIVNNLGSRKGTATLHGNYASVTILSKKGIHFINTSTNGFLNISAISLPSTNVRSISFWYYLSSITKGYILDGRQTTQETYMNGAYNQFGTAWTSAKIYVNGGASKTLGPTVVPEYGGIQSFFNNVTSSWQHITIVSNNVIPSTIINLFSAWYNGSINQGTNIIMGKVTVYDRVVSQSENNANYLAGLIIDTSWTNTLSTGNRTNSIIVTINNMPNLPSNGSFLVDGVVMSGQYPQNTLNASSNIVFDFVTSRIINGFKFYGQSLYPSELWLFAFEGSADNLSWTTIVPSYSYSQNVFGFNRLPFPTDGFTFTNTNAYRYYRFRWISGTGDADLAELEWKISEPVFNTQSNLLLSYLPTVAYNSVSSFRNFGNIGSVTETYTIEFFFNAYSFDSYANACDMNYSNYSVGSNCGPRLEGSVWVWSGSTTTGALAATDMGALSTNVWYYTAFTMNSGTVNVYLNSTQKATNIASSAGYLTTFGSVVLGTGFQLDTNRYFRGSIGNFRIYNKALSASESLANFNANRGLFGI
jgi:hypothetical protein